VQAVTIHSMVLTETAGTTNESVIFYVPAASGDGSHPAVASASGTKVMTLEVPKGTSIVIAPLGNDEGMFFENGVYIALSGGTPSLTLGIS